MPDRRHVGAMVQIELSAEELEMIRAMRQRAKASPGSSLDPAVSPIHHTSNPSSPVTSPEIDKAGQSTIASSSSDSDFLSAEVFQELQIPQPDSVRPGYQPQPPAPRSVPLLHELAALPALLP